MGFPPWGSLRALGTACGSPPRMIAVTCVFPSTHKPISRNAEYPHRKEAFSPTAEPEEHQHGARLGGGRAMPSSTLKQGQKELIKGWIRKKGFSHPHLSRLSLGLLLLCPASLTATALSAIFLSPAGGGMAASSQARPQEKGTEGVSVFGDWERPGLTRSYVSHRKKTSPPRIVFTSAALETATAWADARQGLALFRNSCHLHPLHFLLQASVFSSEKKNNTPQNTKRQTKEQQITKPKCSMSGGAEKRQIRSSCPSPLRAHGQSMPLKAANTELVRGCTVPRNM